MFRRKSFIFRRHFTIILKFNIKSVDRNTEYQEMHSNLSKRQLRKTLTTLYIHRFLYLYIH